VYILLTKAVNKMMLQVKKTVHSTQ